MTTTRVPSYYRQAQRRIAPKGIPWQPEHRLIAAMLEQAVWDRTQRTWYTTQRWICAMSEQPFGFAWCCRQIDQDPEAVKEAILGRWAERGGEGVTHRPTRTPPPYRVGVERVSHST